MEKHQLAAIIMAVIVMLVSFMPIFVNEAFTNPQFFLMQKGWLYPLVGTGIAAVLVVAAFWPTKKD